MSGCWGRTKANFSIGCTSGFLLNASKVSAVSMSESATEEAPLRPCRSLSFWLLLQHDESGEDGETSESTPLSAAVASARDEVVEEDKTLLQGSWAEGWRQGVLITEVLMVSSKSTEKKDK